MQSNTAVGNAIHTAIHTAIHNANYATCDQQIFFARVQAERAARLSPQQLAAQREEEARKQEEETRKLLQKLPRPTMASRTETSVSLNLSRGNKEEQVQCILHLKSQCQDCF